MVSQLQGLFGVFRHWPQQLATCPRCSCAVQPPSFKLSATEGDGIGTMETKMRKFAKVALGALMVAGAATATTAAITTPAEARVSAGIGLGFPGYYGGHSPPADSSAPPI